MVCEQTPTTSDTLLAYTAIFRKTMHLRDTREIRSSTVLVSVNARGLDRPTTPCKLRACATHH